MVQVVALVVAVLVTSATALLLFVVGVWRMRLREIGFLRGLLFWITPSALMVAMATYAVISVIRG